MDQPLASSSRITLDAAPRPPPLRAIGWRRTRRAAAAFAIALSLPHLAAASPLPTPIANPGHDPHPALGSRVDDPGGESLAAWGLRILHDACQMVVTQRQLLPTDVGGFQKRTVHDFYYDVQGFQHVPSPYVELKQTMAPGFIVLSYFISLVGGLCTLELLLRRTSNRGLSNIILLASAGICFGSVSTFAMHFIGNQSLALHHPLESSTNPYPTIYLSYSSGYTVLSLVASCAAMTFAFFVMGTDIRFREWRNWPCVPGHRARQGGSNWARTRDDYNRWKTHKTKIRKSANVSTIFQQAGMVTSWSIMDAQSRRQTGGGWREWILTLGRSEGKGPYHEQTDLHEQIGEYTDEDTVIKHDKELGEIDFRLGRSAARLELEKRQGRIESPQTQTDSTESRTPNSSIHHVSALPKSPLAAYYSDIDCGAKINGHGHAGPNEQNGEVLMFTPGFTFPARQPMDSTTNLLPPRPEVLVNGAAYAAAPHSKSTDAIPIQAPQQNAYLQSGRRASLPVITPPPARIASTLSRIQSLPEHEHENGQPPSHRNSLKQQTKRLSDVKEPHPAEGNSAEAEDLDAVPYDDDEPIVQRSGWRQRLRFKLQTGAPLTRVEQAQRFLGLDVVTWSEVIKIMFTGMVAGWGVAAMHYIGQVSIKDIPYIAYRVSYVVGSVIIASGAVIVALYIMFIMLRPKLKHSWASKIVVAIILAGAVCGMHYFAMMGTIYGFPSERRPSDTGSMTGSNRAITGVVAALAFVACLGVTIFIVINSIRDRKERARRRRVVVASVILDDQDRILVSAIDGLLPMCDIASLTPTDDPSKKQKGANGGAGSAEAALGVDLTTSNDAFVQAIKMSWSWRNPFWSSLNPFASLSSFMGQPEDPYPAAPLANQIANQLAPTPYMSQRGSVVTTAESVVSSVAVPGAARVSIARFLEKFAISATQLSVRLTGQHEGLSRLGVLYDQILTTGWVRLRNGKDTVSKGQLIFLVRRVISAQERSDLLSRHFIFAEPTAVAFSLHKTLSTPYEHVMPFLEDMRGFVDNTMRMTLRPNTLYSGVVIVQATPFDGLRILLDRRNRSQIPMREVCTFSTLPGLPVNVTDNLAGTLEEIGEAITWLDGMSVLSVISRNMAPDNTKMGGPRVGRLLAALERAVIPLLDQLLSQEDMAHILPRLTLHPILIPMTPAAPQGRAGAGWAAPHIIVFYANYDVAVNTFAEKWLPFSLFRAQHQCVMAGKIGSVMRAAEAAAERGTPRIPSPTAVPSGAMTPTGVPPNLAASPDPARYNYGRRPSKVQFEVPDIASSSTSAIAPASGIPSAVLSSYSFPPRPSDSPSPTAAAFAPPLFSSRDRQPPRRSSIAKSILRDEPLQLDTRDWRAPGVAAWDPNWLVNLLRTRLRTDA